MSNVVRLTSDLYAELWSHLLSGHGEQVAFAFAEALPDEEGVTFVVREVYLVLPHELEVQADYHVSLTDEAQAKVIKLAWDKQLALGEFHSHPGGRRPAEFSPSDRHGLDEFVPHVRWRLRRQPYFAVVTAPNDFDALVWRNSNPEGLDELSAGDLVLHPTGLTMEHPWTQRGRADG